MVEIEPLKLGKVISGATTKKFQFVTENKEDIAVGESVVVLNQENTRILGVIENILTINEYATEGSARQTITRGNDKTYEDKTVFVCKCNIVSQLNGKKSGIPQLPPIAFKPVYGINEFSLTYKTKAE